MQIFFENIYFKGHITYIRLYNFLIPYVYTNIELCTDSNMIPRDHFAIITFGTRTWITDQIFGYHYCHLSLKRQYTNT